MKKRFLDGENILLAIFSFLFSLGQVIGYNCYKFDNSKINSINTYICTLILAIGFIILFVIFNKDKQLNDKLE